MWIIVVVEMGMLRLLDPILADPLYQITLAATSSNEVADIFTGFVCIRHQGHFFALQMVSKLILPALSVAGGCGDYISAPRWMQLQARDRVAVLLTFAANPAVAQFNPLKVVKHRRTPICLPYPAATPAGSSL